MYEIIKIEQAEVGGEQIQTVNARDLHAFLEVKSDFRNWIKNRISDFGFVENQDFISFGKNLAKPQGGRPSLEYFVSLSMAKELAMVERTKKGKEARLYFIECERRAKEASSSGFAIPHTFSEALRLAADLADKNANLIAQKKEDAPKVAFAEDVQATAREETITGAAKILGIKPRQFFDWLRAKGFIYKQSAQATAKSIDNGLMVVRFAAIMHEDGEAEKKAYAHVTGKGLYGFYKRLADEGLIEKNSQLELAGAK